MKKGMKLIALAALVCAVLSCELGAPSGVKKRGGVDHTDEDVAPEDKAVFTGSGIFYYLPDSHTRGSEHETFDWAKKDVTKGKAEYRDGMYISKEYILKNVSFTFKRDGTFSYKSTFIELKTNTTLPQEGKGTYTISEGQLICTSQYENEKHETKTSKTPYTISYNGDTLVLKELDAHEYESAFGMKPIYTLTRMSGSLNVFGK